NLPLGKIDAGQLAWVRGDQREQPHGLGKRVADVENAPLATVTPERPGDLDGPLVHVGWRGQVVRALPCDAGRRRSRGSVVECAEAPELVARRQVRDQARARERMRAKGRD